MSPRLNDIMTRDLRLTPAFFHLLLCMANGPKHGYGMMLEIEERTEGALRLGPSSLYYSLSRLEASGLIEEKDGVDAAAETHGERRRYYALTRRGRQRLKDELDVLSGVIRHARAAGVLVGGR